MKITESQNGQIYPEDTFSHGTAQLISGIKQNAQYKFLI